MTYKGKAEGGPWDGKEVEGERELVLHPSLSGAYRWSAGTWRWQQPQVRGRTPAAEGG